MDRYADLFPALALVAVLLLAALAVAPLLARLRIPAPAAFLGVGLIAGALDLGPTDQLSSVRIEQIGAVGLFVILFQGGLATGFAAWRRTARSILILGLPGTAATALLLAVFGRVALGLDWSVALLVGVALAPTDPAAVYAVLRGRTESLRARTILEGESGVNDPVAISLMVAVTAAVATTGASNWDGVLRFVEELGIGTAGGLVGALALRALLQATPHIDDEQQAVAMVLAVLLVGGVTAWLHGSGFLAVYLCGLLLADAWARQDSRRHAVPEALSAAAEVLLFALLGAAFAPVLTGADVLRGAVLALGLMLVVRPAVGWLGTARVGLRAPERRLVVWGGLKGVVPLLLAAYPSLETFDAAETVQGTVLVATALSLVVQGVVLARVAARNGAA
jgi:cell volume regulation protein A